MPRRDGEDDYNVLSLFTLADWLYWLEHVAAGGEAGMSACLFCQAFKNKCNPCTGESFGCMYLDNDTYRRRRTLEERLAAAKERLWYAGIFDSIPEPSAWVDGV